MRTNTLRTRAAVVTALLSVGSLAIGAAPAFSAAKKASARANGPCTKVGATATIGGKPFVCQAKLGKKFWTAVEAPTTTAVPAPTTTLSAAAADAAASNWDSIVAKAKEEGKVVFYTSQDPTLVKEAGEKFKAKYGITVEVFRDVDAVLLPKIEAEKTANKPIADMIAHASAPWATQKDADGWFTKVVGPNFSSPNFNRAANVSKSGNYFTSGAAILTFGWNTKLWPQGIRDYPDLINPQLAGGKLGVIDPAGSAALTDFYNYLEEKFGLGFITKMADLRPRIYNSALTAKAALISGEISATLYTAVPATEKAAGAPVDWGFSDTVWGARFNTSVLKNAPHPNAAQLWADFMITKDAQESISKVSSSPVPGIGFMISDKVRTQNVAKLTPALISASYDRWKQLFL